MSSRHEVLIRILALLQSKTLIETKFRTLKCFNIRLCDQWKMLQCWQRTGYLPSFLVPTLGDLTAQEYPPPGISLPRGTERGWLKLSIVVSAGINVLMKWTRLESFQSDHGKRVRFTSEARSWKYWSVLFDWDRKEQYIRRERPTIFWMQLEKHPLSQTCEDRHWQSNRQDIQWGSSFP